MFIENLSLSLANLGPQPGILYEARVTHTFKPYWKSLPLAILLDCKKSLFFDCKRSIFELHFGGGTVCFPEGLLGFDRRGW